MIVNDFESKKTIDTETGVYLSCTGEHALEGYVFFQITDGPAIIKLTTITEVKKPTQDSLEIIYRIETPPDFFGQPNRAGYVELISKLLETYKVHYGPNRATKGSTICKAIISKQVVAAVQNWEVRNG